MTSLRTFLDTRDAELIELEAKALSDLQAIGFERAEIARARLALEGPLPSIEAEPGAVKSLRKASGIPQATIKGAVLNVMLGDRLLADENDPPGMTALEILDAVNRSLNTDYPRTSLSPQLSRLKEAGRIDRVGNRWILVDQENDPAHSKSGEAGAQGLAGTDVKPSGEVEHEKGIA